MAADIALAATRARPGTLVLSRALAIGAICSAAAHLAGSGAHGVVHGLVLLVMAAVCLRCVPALWSRPSPTVFGTVALMSLAMLALHAGILDLGGAGSGHQHAASAADSAALMDPLTAVTLISALVESALATIAVFLTTRTPERCETPESA